MKLGSFCEANSPTFIWIERHWSRGTLVFRSRVGVFFCFQLSCSDMFVVGCTVACHSKCVCEVVRLRVCPQHGSPSVSRRAASCSFPLISATAGTHNLLRHPLRRTHARTNMHACKPSVRLSACLFADTHWSVRLSAHIPIKLIKASHLPSVCLSVCLHVCPSICFPSKWSQMMALNFFVPFF